MATIVTRFGRTVKRPQFFEPDEEVMDDWGDDDHDSEIDSDIETENEYKSDDDEEEEEEEDEDEEDEMGNLKDFVVDSDSESEDA